MGFRLPFFGKQAAREEGKLPQVKVFGFEGKQGKPPTKNFNQCILEYKSWVYACVNKNAHSVAKLKLGVFKSTKVADGVKVEPVLNHPLVDLLKKVNPHMNSFELWTITMVFLELTGNGYWWIPRNGLGAPAELWYLPSNWMRVVPSETDFIAGYVMKVPGKPQMIPFEVDEICHFKYPNPQSLYYGFAPPMAAALSIDLNNSFKQWQSSFLDNNAEPAGVLSTENSLSDTQFTRLKDQWNRRHRGERNAGKIAVLENGLNYTKTGSNLKDMQIKDIERSVRDEIFAVYGVPASKLGLVEDVNRANAEANDYTYQKETILPKTILLEQKMNEKVTPMFDDKLFVKFENPVPDDKRFRLEEQTAHIKSGYSSIDDERAKDNEEPYKAPETESPLIPFNMVPAGTETVVPEKAKSVKKATTEGSLRKWRTFIKMTTPQINLMERIMKRYFRQQQSIVMAEFNKLKTIKAVEKAGLQASLFINFEEEVTRLKETTSDSVREGFVSGATLGAEETGIAFDIIEPNIVRAIDLRLDFFARKVNDTTFTLINDALKSGIEAGDSINDIAKRLDKVFDFRIKHSSKLTAQTEIIGAVNDGQLKSYQEAGVEKKEWVTAGDEKVRHSHVATDGQEVSVTETFVTGDGNQLLYPGDRSTGAPAKDIINCRCTVNPVVEE